MKDLHCSSVPVMMDVVAVDDRWNDAVFIPRDVFRLPMVSISSR
jgi:hypothetical protein